MKNLHLTRLRQICLILSAVLVLAGCSSQAPPSSPSDNASVPNQNLPVEGNQYEYENAVKTAACMTDKGWEAEVDPQGGWGVVAGFPPEQADIYRADYVDCVDEIGLGSVEITEDVAQRTFNNNVRVTQCLISAGFTTSETPNERTFVSKTMEDPQADVWNPYELIAKDALVNAVTTCPQ